MTPDRDVIFAHASGAGRAALAVLRLSGAGCADVLEALLAGPLPPPRRASLRRIHGPDAEVLDQALVLWLPGPASFTGEDQAELHLHGGLAVRAAVSAALARVPGCRPAEPGEFTRRAFLNGKLDLSAVEGLADLIDAETEAQRRQALQQLEGGLSARVFGWQDRIVDNLALLEAGLDFSDEEDIPISLPAGFRAGLSDLRGEIDALARRSVAGERIREGFVVVIAGPPNAGKSTLLNAIARRDVAIVSAPPGTTRDMIELRCDLGGLPVTLVDTAGLREASDRDRAAGNLPGTGQDGCGRSGPVARSCGHGPKATRYRGGRRPPGSRRCSASSPRPTSPPRPPPVGALAVSAATGQGLPDLLAEIAGRLQQDRVALGLGRSGVADNRDRERHRLAFEEVASCLVRADLALHTGRAELAAEDLRLALRALGRVVGTVDVEQILDRIFASFCIGKCRIGG